MATQRHRFVTRIEREGARPHWWVRFQRMVKDERVCLWPMRFYDHELGSKAKALAAAIAYRDERLGQVPASRKVRVPPGHGYVRKTIIDGRPAWEGWVRLEGMKCSRTKNFIDVWGPRVAKRRSLEWLERHRRAIAERAAAPKLRRAA